MNDAESTSPLAAEAAAEEHFVTTYVELTGVPERTARDVYMYLDVIRERDGARTYTE